MLKENLILHIEQYRNFLENSRFAVAVSGGIDSLSLLLVANEWAKNNNSQAIGITVDHQLRAESRDESVYVNELCSGFGIEHHILTWNGEKPTKNVELIARENRYRLICDFCKQNNISYVLVAHHLQDQAETFFIRLFRGSGLDGLSSMKNITNLYDINILRPFLSAKKEVLREYLIENNIRWIEDPSNNDEKYFRNKVRNFLNSFDNRENILRRIDFAVSEIGKAKQFIDDEILKIENKIMKFNSFGTCTIDKKKLLSQNENIILKLLAKISMKISGNIYKPRLEKLKRLLKTIMEKEDIKYTFYGCIFEKYNDNLLMVYREYNSIGDDQKLVYGKEVIWDNRFRVILEKDVDNLVITHVKEGEFNIILNDIKKTNFSKYKEMVEIKGIEKRIFYTIPIVSDGKKYLFDCKHVILYYNSTF
jgi:tRNA(Ile)-lysidine synthase